MYFQYQFYKARCTKGKNQVDIKLLFVLSALKVKDLFNICKHIFFYFKNVLPFLLMYHNSNLTVHICIFFHFYEYMMNTITCITFTYFPSHLNTQLNNVLKYMQSVTKVKIFTYQMYTFRDELVKGGSLVRCPMHELQGHHFIA